MFSIDQSLSLFIPRVYRSVQEHDIMRIFELLNLGIVKHVDFIPKKGKNGSKYNAVYIHFSKWFNTVASANFQENVLNPVKDAKLVYDDPWFWYVLPNMVPTDKPAESVLDPLVPEFIPNYRVPFTPTSGFPFNECGNNPKFDDKEWLKNSGLLGLLTEPKIIYNGEVFQYSKFARDTANKEITDLREEVKCLQKQLFDEKMSIRESYFEPKYWDAVSECEKNKKMMEEATEENGKLQYQLDEKDIELYYTQRDNQLLNSEVKNMKDELQATYTDNDILQETLERMSDTIIQLKKQLESQEK